MQGVRVIYFYLDIPSVFHIMPAWQIEDTTSKLHYFRPDGLYLTSCAVFASLSVAVLYWRYVMQYIPLTKGKYAIVDDDDYRYLMQWKWHTVKKNHTCYACRGVATGKRNWKQKHIWMHRVILNTPLGMETDHRNHIGLDNRKQNIRVCTVGQNQHNRKKHIKSTSKYKGVCRQRSKWRARICNHNKKLHLGCFDTEIDAANAYDVKAIEIFGKFACTNFRV